MNIDQILTEINQLFDKIITGAINLVPNLIAVLLVGLIGFILARIVQKLIRSFILYLNRNINEKLSSRYLTVDLQGSVSFISKMFFWAILVFTMALAIQILELSFLTSWIDGLIQYLPNILVAAVIIFIGLIAGKLARDLMVTSSLIPGVSKGRYIGRLLQYVIVLVSVIIAVDQLGIDIMFLTNIITIIVAILLFGAALSFGLGSKDSVRNIMGSYYAQKDFQLGTSIRIGEIDGSIVKITATHIFLQTKNGIVTIPGKDFNEEKITLVKNSK